MHCARTCTSALTLAKCGLSPSQCAAGYYCTPSSLSLTANACPAGGSCTTPSPLSSISARHLLGDMCKPCAVCALWRRMP